MHSDSRFSWRAVVALLIAASAAGAQTTPQGRGQPQRGPQAGAAPSLRAPTAAQLGGVGPDSFDVAFHTTKGVFTARVRRGVAPRGADRFWHAVRARYYDGLRFYRVIPGFMAQFGFHGDPAVTRAWEGFTMPDEPVKASNTRGALTFANRGRNTRTVQLFVNTGNNLNLDALGFTPIGQVLDGMGVVDSLYSGYGEGAPRGGGPDQDLIAQQGNAYLTRAYPRLDAIDSARVVRRWPTASTP